MIGIAIASTRNLIAQGKNAGMTSVTPRFSILTVLVVTAYVAVAFAGFRTPAIMSMVWLLILLSAVTGVLCGRRGVAAFSGGFIVFAGSATLVALLVIAMSGILGAYLRPTSTTREILMPLAQLTSGLLGGAFILSQYRVIQSSEAGAREE